MKKRTVAGGAMNEEKDGRSAARRMKKRRGREDESALTEHHLRMEELGEMMTSSRNCELTMMLSTSISKSSKRTLKSSTMSASSAKYLAFSGANIWVNGNHWRALLKQSPRGRSKKGSLLKNHHHGERPPPLAARILQLIPIRRKPNADKWSGEGAIEAI